MFKKVRGFFSEVNTEMAKVTWPTREELWNSTLVVLGAMAFLAIFVGLCDLVLSNLMNVFIR